MEHLSALFNSIQKWLFPAFEEELGEFGEKEREFVRLVELARPDKFMEAFRWHGHGRPRLERLSLFNAFVAKSVFKYPDTDAPQIKEFSFKTGARARDRSEQAQRQGSRVRSGKKGTLQDPLDSRARQLGTEGQLRRQTCASQGLQKSAVPPDVRDNRDNSEAALQPALPGIAQRFFEKNGFKRQTGKSRRRPTHKNRIFLGIKADSRGKTA